jgi:hypothetical protein
MTYREKTQPSSRRWTKPSVKRLEAGAAQFSTTPAHESAALFS